MKTFEILPHTADVRIYVKADSYHDLLVVSLEALVSVIIHDNNFHKDLKVSKEKINIDSPDNTALLIDFLSEALALMHKNKSIYNKVEILQLSDNSFKAILSGYAIDKFDEDIKAVTYHEAEVLENDGIFSSFIVLDI